MKRCYDFSPDQVEAINRLSDELGIGKTDVLHNGLRLLRHAAREVRRGRSLAVVEGDRVVGQILGPWNDLEPVTAGA